MQFRKKPVVIDAWSAGILIDAAMSNWGKLPKPVQEAYEKGGWVFCSDSISIPTLEGTMRAERKDWIIRGVSGEFYPCKPEIFEATYDVVEGQTSINN